MYLLHVFCQERSVFDSSGRLIGNLKTRQLSPLNKKNIRIGNPEVYVRHRKTKDQYNDPALLDRMEKLAVRIEKF